MEDALNALIELLTDVSVKVFFVCEFLGPILLESLLVTDFEPFKCQVFVLRFSYLTSF